MRNAHEAVPGHLRQLNASSALLAEVYSNNSISITPDNKREINGLIQAGVLMDADDAYKITRHLKRHLDAIMRRKRTYAVGENVRAQIESLNSLAVMCEQYARQGMIENQSDHANEFEDIVFEIYQDIDATLSHLRALVDSEFGDVAGFSDKSRQNDHYLKRIEEAADTFALLEEAEVAQTLRGNPILEVQSRVYRRQLISRLPAWRSAFLDIANVLRQHVHALRRVEPKARMLRRLAFHLQRDQSYDPPEEPRPNETIDSWMRVVEGVRIETHPQAHHPAQEETLRQIAANIPIEATRLRNTRNAGEIAADGLEATIEIEMETTPWRTHYDALLKSAADGPASALAWHQKTDMAIGIDLWLLYVHAVASANDESWSYDMISQIMPHGPFDGVLWIEDIVLCTRP